MSDATSHSGRPEPLDPKRPWVDDPRELPSEMNWVQTLTNPFGETSRLHFTRAWTGLFFVRLLWRVGFIVLAIVFGAAGVENASNFVPPLWAFMILVVITAMASVVLHIRRLSDAKRSPLWAMIVFVPVLAGFAGFLSGIGGASAEYEVASRAAALEREGVPRKVIAVELERDGAARLLAREILVRLELQQVEALGDDPQTTTDATEEIPAMTDPAVAVLLAELSLDLLDLTDAQRTRVQDALDEIAAEREGGEAEGDAGADARDGERRGRSDSREDEGDEPPSREQQLRGELVGIQGEWRGMLPLINTSEVSALSYTLDAATGSAFGFWAIPSFFVMLWSLLWVGRLPTGGGTIRSRFEGQNDGSTDLG
ncbi:MAG: hypothetical protein AAFR33_06625 [Pseudomonadota bacterium]